MQPNVIVCFYAHLLTINFKTSIKCRLQLESPVGDSQTKLSARNSLVLLRRSLKYFRCCEIIKVKQNISTGSISEFR